ncbi:response regulator [Patescibacteria group bacterium]|nr:response regulator [Patescibacteria group bacterium]
MKQILLVEDDPFVIDIYTTKLKEAGFFIEIAEDGEEALRKIKEKKPDLLVLDIVLPNIDGWELLEKIRTELGFEDLKVVVLSNLSQKSEVEKSLKFGVIKYFIKAHFTPSEVVEEIKKILG